MKVKNKINFFIGYEGNTFAEAEKAIELLLTVGLYPKILTGVNIKGRKSPLWEKFRKQWNAEINKRREENGFSNHM